MHHASRHRHSSLSSRCKKLVGTRKRGGRTFGDNLSFFEGRDFPLYYPRLKMSRGVPWFLVHSRPSISSRWVLPSFSSPSVTSHHHNPPQQPFLSTKWTCQRTHNPKLPTPPWKNLPRQRIPRPREPVIIMVKSKKSSQYFKPQ